MKHKANANSKIFTVANYGFFILAMFACIYPFWYIFVFSLSDPMQAIRGVYFLPRGFTLQNYLDVFTRPGILQAAGVSVLRTVTGTTLTVLACSFFAYLCTKQKMYFRKFVYRFTVVTMYFNAGLIPWFLTMRAYGLNNNFLVYILPSAIGAFNVILIKTFIEQLPASLEEAAHIDGAGVFTVFFKIIMPLSTPILATIAVFSAVHHWNSWFDNLIFMVGRPELNTLQLMLWNILNQAALQATRITELAQAEQLARQQSPVTIRMTATMIVTFPILFVYPFAQRYFVKGIMIGAIKG
ncbi:MAG: carbohydrate ABC transporter permease [Defluviitaleaceae bacterium]|nr:carbohydrate ABC transporter permease [Defluviitaleaceae bacterium]